MTTTVSREHRAPATKRILAAARALVERGGAAEVSMGDVASAAGVSKALVHYHFHDKETLLLALVEAAGTAILNRTRHAIAQEGSEHALDHYWSSVEHELRSGDLRILAALAEYDSESVREISRRIAAQRREITTEQVAQIFSRLGLTPRVPAALIADTVMAFVDGLAAAYALDSDRSPRPAFDVLWLALLTLAE